jgi:hypothetical protein
MNEKAIIEELQSIKKLLVLQLLASRVQPDEIQEILEVGHHNFNRSFRRAKLTERNRARKRKEENEEIIKRLLILLLLYQGTTVRDIVKVTGASSATLYKFLPNDIGKKRKTK